MKIIEKNKSIDTYYLKNMSLEDGLMKEIMDKYPDKVADVYEEGKYAVLVLNNMRIKFTKKNI